MNVIILACPSVDVKTMLPFTRMNQINHPHIPELEYNYIIDGIYIGTNQCCQMHFDTFLIQHEGITVDLSLEKERLDQPEGVEFYVWIPVTDHTALSQDQLRFGVTTLQQLVQMGKKIYVHCKNGHGRAPSLVAAYLTQQAYTADEAAAYIKKQRPVIHLDPEQLEAVKQFASQKTKSFN